MATHTKLSLINSGSLSSRADYALFGTIVEGTAERRCKPCEDTTTMHILALHSVNGLGEPKDTKTILTCLRCGTIKTTS